MVPEELLPATTINCELRGGRTRNCCCERKTTDDAWPSHGLRPNDPNDNARHEPPPRATHDPGPRTIDIDHGQ